MATLVGWYADTGIGPILNDPSEEVLWAAANPGLGIPNYDYIFYWDRGVIYDISGATPTMQPISQLFIDNKSSITGVDYTGNYSEEILRSLVINYPKFDIVTITPGRYRESIFVPQLPTLLSNGNFMLHGLSGTGFLYNQIYYNPYQRPFITGPGIDMYQLQNKLYTFVGSLDTSAITSASWRQITINAYGNVYGLDANLNVYQIDIVNVTGTYLGTVNNSFSIACADDKLVFLIREGVGDYSLYIYHPNDVTFGNELQIITNAELDNILLESVGFLFTGPNGLIYLINSETVYKIQAVLPTTVNIELTSDNRFGGSGGGTGGIGANNVTLYEHDGKTFNDEGVLV